MGFCYEDRWSESRLHCRARNPSCAEQVFFRMLVCRQHWRRNSQEQPRAVSVPWRFSRFSCPVALEIQAVDLRRVPGKQTYCAPSPIGSVHHGLLIRAVHFNTFFMVNYMKLEDPMLRARLSQDPFHCRRSACGWCGQVCRHEDPLYWTSRKPG